MNVIWNIETKQQLTDQFMNNPNNFKKSKDAHAVETLKQPGIELPGTNPMLNNNITTNSISNIGSNNNNNNNNNNTRLQTPTAMSGDNDDISETIMQTLYGTLKSSNSTEPVSLIIYELDYVLATIPKRLDKYEEIFLNNENDNFEEEYLKYKIENIENIDTNNIYSSSIGSRNPFLLMFGGIERVKSLNKHLSNMINKSAIKQKKQELKFKKNNKIKIKNPKCFIFCKRPTFYVITLLTQIGINNMFVTVGMSGGEKIELSHVIGNDHLLMKQNENKEHLIVLKLMNHFKRTHDNVLYIGHNLDAIEQLSKIRACQTYHVQTLGLTENDMNRIESKFLG